MHNTDRLETELWQLLGASLAPAAKLAKKKELEALALAVAEAHEANIRARVVSQVFLRSEVAEEIVDEVTSKVVEAFAFELDRQFAGEKQQHPELRWLAGGSVVDHMFTVARKKNIPATARERYSTNPGAPEGIKGLKEALARRVDKDQLAAELSHNIGAAALVNRRLQTWLPEGYLQKRLLEDGLAYKLGAEVAKVVIGSKERLDAKLCKQARNVRLYRDMLMQPIQLAILRCDPACKPLEARHLAEEALSAMEILRFTYQMSPRDDDEVTEDFSTDYLFGSIGFPLDDVLASHDSFTIFQSLRPLDKLLLIIENRPFEDEEGFAKLARASGCDGDPKYPIEVLKERLAETLNKANGAKELRDQGREMPLRPATVASIVGLEPSTVIKQLSILHKKFEAVSEDS